MADDRPDMWSTMGVTGSTSERIPPYFTLHTWMFGNRGDDRARRGDAQTRRRGRRQTLGAAGPARRRLRVKFGGILRSAQPAEWETIGSREMGKGSAGKKGVTGPNPRQFARQQPYEAARTCDRQPVPCKLIHPKKSLPSGRGRSIAGIVVFRSARESDSGAFAAGGEPVELTAVSPSNCPR